MRKQSADREFRCFVERLEEHEILREAEIVCVGRFVYRTVDGRDIPDLRALYSGTEPHHLAARIDFAYRLLIPSLGWTKDAVAKLLGVSTKRVDRWLASRSAVPTSAVDYR